MNDGTPANWPGILSLTSHEIKNALTVVVGYLRMMQGGKAGELTERQTVYLNSVLKSAGTLREIADQLSELAKYGVGEKRLKRRGPVDLCELLTETARDLPEVPDTPAEIDVAFTGPAVIDDGDGVALRAAFKPLFSRFRSELIESRRLLIRGTVRTIDNEPTICVAIGENGQLESVAQASPSRLEEFELKERSGLGVTLVLAHWIIEAHGGRLLQTLPKKPRLPVLIMLPRRSRLPEEDGQVAAEPGQASGKP